MSVAIVVGTWHEMLPGIAYWLRHGDSLQSMESLILLPSVILPVHVIPIA